MDAIICVTVVLPLLPVTAMSGRLNCARQADASDASASLLSSTSIPEKPAGSLPRWAIAATAPLAWASARKSLASKRSPLSATNRSPGCSVRVSLWTRATACEPSPTSLPPGIQCSAWAKVNMPLIAHSWHRSAAWACAWSENGCFTPAISW